MNELAQLVKISKYAGGRFDLVQASGGNASVKKADGTMLIKASGYLLSEVEMHRGYCLINNKKVLGILDEPWIVRERNREKIDRRIMGRIQKCVIKVKGRPSIEVFLHALLEKYTLHLHPIAVNAVVCSRRWKEILGNIFPEVALVEYRAPGISLARELKVVRENFFLRYGRTPEVLFLQNHGLIITSNSLSKIWELLEDTLGKIERALKMDLSRYKLTTEVAHLINDHKKNLQVAYLCEDEKANHLLKNRYDFSPLFPDMMVFCGWGVVRIRSLDDRASLLGFRRRHGISPRVISYKDKLFFIAPNIKKARELEEVFKAHLFALSLLGRYPQRIPQKELKYLCRWEAEKYRQQP